MSSEAALTLPVDTVKPVETPKLVELPKRKRSMLPLLTVLFCLSYGLMVLLVIEQNRTITSQRWLITELMSDSKELNSLKGKLVQQRNAEKRADSKVQSRTPSSQAAPQENSKKTKARRSSAEHPPRLASDTPDSRRALNSI